MSGQITVIVAVNQRKVRKVEVSPDPDGNRAQRRAWKKLTKKGGRDA